MTLSWRFWDEVVPRLSEEDMLAVERDPYEPAVTTLLNAYIAEVQSDQDD